MSSARLYSVPNGRNRIKRQSIIAQQSVLSLYFDPPKSKISFVVLHKYGLYRLKVLQAIEDVNQQVENSKFSKEYFDKLEGVLVKMYTPKALMSSGDDDEVSMVKQVLTDPNVDLISHYILRLAFCRTPEVRQWFMQLELDLFRYRLVRHKREIKPLLAHPSLNFIQEVPVSTLEGDPYLMQFVNESERDHSDPDARLIHRVPFTEALDLIKGRKVVLRDGFAYIPERWLQRLLTAKFRSNLSQALTTFSRYFGRIQQDPRLSRIVQVLGNRGCVHTGPDYISTSSSITPEMLDELAPVSYAPCMRRLHQELRAKHHLKHMGRLQYGLFLKGIGVTLDDSMRFWRSEFTKMMTDDKFDKEYSYGVRYNYGKEGKQTNYTPYSCMKIIMSNPPGPPDYHGCVFKHCDEGTIKKMLSDMQLRDSHVDMVLGYVQKKNYQSACTRAFECSHGMPDHSASTISHPNMYFEQSRQHLAAVNKENVTAVSDVKMEIETVVENEPRSEAEPKPEPAQE